MSDHGRLSAGVWFWHLAAGRHSGHHHRLMMPTWPNHSSALLKPIFSERWILNQRGNQGGETQRLKCKSYGNTCLNHVYACLENNQHCSVMMLPSSNLAHITASISFGLNLVHVSDDETLPNSMALVESVCVLTPQGCFLTFLLPRVDQGHDLEAFRKKMRVKCHIGHTGWLYGITCLAHLINVAYDFPVNWSQKPNMQIV